MEGALSCDGSRYAQYQTSVRKPDGNSCTIETCLMQSLSGERSSRDELVQLWLLADESTLTASRTLARPYHQMPLWRLCSHRGHVCIPLLAAECGRPPTLPDEGGTATEVTV